MVRVDLKIRDISESVWTALHAEMREGLLDGPTDYSTRPLRNELKSMPRHFNLEFTFSNTPLVAAVKANQVFLPVLENASKASKLRTTLGVFERSKFFFNLPGFILESIEAVQ